MEKARLVVGFIRGSHGYSGECKVESASGDYEHFLNLKEVFVTLGAMNHNGSLIGDSIIIIRHRIISFFTFCGIFYHFL